MKIYRIILLIIAFLSVIDLTAKDLRVEVEELNKNITEYKLLDTRESNTFLLGHIKTALNFPINLTYEHRKINGKIIQPTKMQSIIRNLGLKIDDNIVVYDDGTFFDAARLFWTLEVYGFKNVKLLNGGYKQWKKHKFITTKEVEKVIKSDYIVEINNNRLATKFTTLVATKNPNQIILDARGIAAYDGETSVSKRYGHIKNAIHFPATHNIEYTGKQPKLKDTSDLKNLYHKIKKDKKIIVYCAIGRNASINYFSLRELGYDVANYDSSWKEWGNDFSLPIDNPLKKF